MELRFLPAGAVQLRERPGRLPTIRGLAVVYDSLSGSITHAGQTFRELIKPGAFATSLDSSSEILARFQHEAVIGRRSDGTLRLMPDSRGIKYEIDTPDTSAGREAIAAIRGGKVRGSSFGMIVHDDIWRNDPGGLIREIQAARLLEVSPVSFPAYAATSVALSSDASNPGLMRMRLALAERE